VDAVSPESKYDVVALLPTFVPPRKTLYPVTPTLSVEAFHVRLICEEEAVVAVRPAGTDGDVESATGLLTVTVTPALVVKLLDESAAIARSVCAPLVAVAVFQENAYGEVVSRVPTFAPSNWNRTLATATLSDAFAVTFTVPETVDPLAGAVIDTVGGVVSGVALFTVTVTAALVVELLAMSVAIARNVCVPLVAVAVFQENPYGEVVSRVPTFAPSNWNCTLATATLSDAFAVTFTVPESVAPPAGAVTETVGGVVSAAALTVSVSTGEVLPAKLVSLL
jgi:hypothetical protein